MARRVLGYAVDFLAAIPPTLLAIEAVLRMRGEAFEAFLDSAVLLVVLVPWSFLLPVIVALWLRRTGLPIPGQFLAGPRPTPRRGGGLGDALLVAGSVWASIPLFYLYELDPTGTVAPILFLIVPVAMAVGSILRRPSVAERETP